VRSETVIEVPADPSLAEELAREDMVEMANLTGAQTGVEGTIFISTAMDADGPRVKYFVHAGRTQPSFSISIGDAPAVVANSLPQRVVRRVAAGYRMGIAEQGCPARFLAPGRHLDAARGQ
jgi:hypothetical protein